MKDIAQSTEAIKRPITMVLILFIVIIVYFSGPSTAFLTSGYPTMAHNPGSKDINVSVTFYKERYEAIGTIGAKLMKLPPNPTPTEITAFGTTPWVYETVGANDYNCWATPYAAATTGQANTSFYSYELDAYYAPGAPAGTHGSWAAGTGFDKNFDIFAYGYMWNPWVNMTNATTIAQNDVTTNVGSNPFRVPGDVNFAYIFIDYTEDLRALGRLGAYNPYNPTWGATVPEYRAGLAALFGYYGYGYNYAGKFTCIFHFRSVPEGIYLAIVPYINGLKVGSSGWDSGGVGVTPEGSKSGSIIMIKDVNTTASTDLNFIEPNGTKRISFTAPYNSGIEDANFITIDVNSDGCPTPESASLDIGTSVTPPRFSFGTDVGSITLSSSATFKMYWTGILTTTQAQVIMGRLKLLQFDPATSAWLTLDTTITASENELKVLIKALT